MATRVSQITPIEVGTTCGMESSEIATGGRSWSEAEHVVKGRREAAGVAF